ncbi:unnamed protein product [Clonostachys rosea f. rosea IK726]|uniref:Uncharacterized protein n=1 Tax=Clonostachys rosea f. rosea IK726 TaxID=1349383 RepID=A0ACA9TQJ2_BIOOC|nr:unnamed protein product [Clonostachys rosea f. rosea IK726]
MTLLDGTPTKQKSYDTSIFLTPDALGTLVLRELEHIINLDHLPSCNGPIGRNARQNRRRTVNVTRSSIILGALLCLRPKQVPEEHLIPAAVCSRPVHNLQLDGLLKQPPQRHRPALQLALLALGAARAHVAVLHDLGLQPALGPVDADPEALPRRVRGEGVRQRRAAAVPDQHAHRVLDVDAVAEHALVPVVAVLVLRVQVQRLELLVALHVQGEGIRPRRFAAVRPVVEVVHAGDGADGPRAEDLGDLGVVRRVAVVEGDADPAAGALDGGEDLGAAGGVYRHGLLAEDVAAEVEGAHDVGVVGAVDGGDDDFVRLCLRDHLVEVGGEVDRDGLVPQTLQLGVGIVETGLVGVAEGDEGACLAVGCCEGSVEEDGSAAGPDQGISFASGRFSHSDEYVDWVIQDALLF